MRMSELKRKEVINVCDCRRLGFVGDMEFDPCTGQIKALIVPGPGCVCGFLGREKEFVIPFEDVCQMGDDIVLVPASGRTAQTAEIKEVRKRE